MSGRNAVHFGAGNIGRGFIGEVLFRNGFHIDFVDINETIIDELRSRGSYKIEFAGKTKDYLTVSGVSGINSKTDGDKVIDAVASADIVTTAIGPAVLPRIAELIARGIEARREKNPNAALDVIACENMIGGSEFLAGEVRKYLSTDALSYARDYIGFPNAAVDRIVPVQHHDDPLAVTVEPFKEWIISQKDRKALDITLDGVSYVENLEPYIERKLFSVNTGHAAVAYSGMRRGYATIGEAVADPKILSRLREILNETGSLLIAKWGFDKAAHEAYIEKIIDRFENPNNPDTCSRVARDPIRKLGFNERFIRPIRELKERSLPYPALLETSAFVLAHTDARDAESVKLESMRTGLDINGMKSLISKITGLSDSALISGIADAYEALSA
ncbi:MAG: mannitol-1-phosphate 5-dehydrogenase [Spirochaetaceae bacterium]|jgi:mannitol-1-phosphate 5-dehydrogenase|nr:mannitol-1-phosphate 5-dehydrogenase [Spirochaetaceae bacterium]